MQNWAKCLKITINRNYFEMNWNILKYIVNYKLQKSTLVIILGSHAIYHCGHPLFLFNFMVIGFHLILFAVFKTYLSAALNSKYWQNQWSTHPLLANQQYGMAFQNWTYQWIHLCHVAAQPAKRENQSVSTHLIRSSS